ncbi:MAG: MATE family efflux transporter, partial [Gammaproteobacteria bacterium]
MSATPANVFVDGPLGRVFARTAVPIAIIMSMNGALGIADAMFLGRYVGPRALEAVTLIFPAFMALSALGVLIGGGMASILARLLGAGRHAEANAVFEATHGMALAMGAALIALYAGLGTQAIGALTGTGPVADMARGYFSILVLASPVGLVLAAQSDALRSEGHTAFMAAGALLVSLSNIGFNYVL